jgi:outer membrane receptor protein involved in Fe transport
MAQQAPTTPPTAEDELQRVVVTANKRSEKQSDVAGMVSVISGNDLERRGARDQEDFLKLTPGVQLNRGDPNNNGITIRGLSSQASPESGGGQQNPSGRYLEDVPLASPIGKGLVADILPFDLDRIEVLRGPQGALFGSGSLGGALRYVLAKPDMKSFGATAQVGVSRVSQGKTAPSLYGMVNVPLNESAALRVVAFDRTSPGYIDNKGTMTKDANKTNQTGGRILFTVKPIKELTATVVTSTQKTSQDDFSYVLKEAVPPSLAGRTQRITALVLGGWPPLGAPYDAILQATRLKQSDPEPSSLKVLRSKDQYRQWEAYYSSMVDWAEAESVASIHVPKMVYFGGDGDLVEAGIPIRIASIIRENRTMLEKQGWTLKELPGQGHGVCMTPDLVVPPVRYFLDLSL